MDQHNPIKTPIFTEQQKQALMALQARHQQMLEADSEYRAMWEKTVEQFQQIALIGDNETDCPIPKKLHLHVSTLSKKCCTA